MNQKPATLLMLCSVLVVGCSSAPPQQAVVTDEATSANYYHGTKDVFVHLIAGSGGSWIFGDVTGSNAEPASAFLVRLNDLAPAFDTRLAECTPQAYPNHHKCSPTHPFREKEVGVISKIINSGIAAGTAGKVTDVSRTYKTSFDESAFNQAVDEALINSGLANERQALLSALDTYGSMRKSGLQELQSLAESASADFDNAESIPLDVQPTVTGLTEYYSNDVDFQALIELVPLSGHTLDEPRVSSEALLPCDARYCMRKVGQAIASLEREIAAARRHIRSKTDGERVFEIQCSHTSHAGYLFTMICPPTLTRSLADESPLPVSLNILARDFERLIPGVLLGDENVQIEVSSNDVSFGNRTDEYLTIAAQTIYYNSQVHTRTKEISIAPGAVVREPIGEFVSPAIDIESGYQRMTPDKADGAEFEFGFAARYRVAGDPVDTTLYVRRPYNVGCVIDNRLKPGSCTQAPSEAEDQPERAESDTEPEPEADIQVSKGE